MSDSWDFFGMPESGRVERVSKSVARMTSSCLVVQENRVFIKTGIVSFGRLVAVGVVEEGGGPSLTQTETEVVTLLWRRVRISVRNVVGN